MKALTVFDPPLCCSSVVCGPNVDPTLIRFAADLKSLERRGVTVERHNLAQEPKAFAEHELVRDWLTKRGEDALPLVLVGDEVAASGAYPTRAELAQALGLDSPPIDVFTPIVAELVAIGASIASNCEPCLRYHVKAATELGVSVTDIARAVELAVKVKDAPHRAVLKLAAQLTQPAVESADAPNGDDV